jgi:hypothetical protein
MMMMMMIIIIIIITIVVRYSVVSIATRYVLGVPGIESRWGARFSSPVHIDVGQTQLPIQWIPGLYRS